MDIKAVRSNVSSDLSSQQSAPAAVAYTPVVASIPSVSQLLRKEKYELSVSDQAIRNAVERANKALDGVDRRFEYSVHEKTGEVIIKVINQATNEIMKEIPNEKLLDLMAKLQELVGLNIDEKR